MYSGFCSFYFNDPSSSALYTLSLHDALPIYAPFGGEIDEDRVTLLKFGGESFRCKFLPASTGSCWVGDCCRVLKFIADEIISASDCEQEHEQEDETAGLGRSQRCEKGTFHPAGDAEDEKKGACPDKGSNAALSAEHRK